MIKRISTLEKERQFSNEERTEDETDEGPRPSAAGVQRSDGGAGGEAERKAGPKPAPEKAAEGKPQSAPAPNRTRLTVGVDLGDQWSNYCILGLEEETLAEGQLRTTREDVASLFGALSSARVIFEVGAHSAWVRGVIVGCEHEVLVANPRLMEGTKRRKRKNDRLDAQKLARLGRVDPQSLFPIEHRSTEVRQDLVVLQREMRW